MNKKRFVTSIVSFILVLMLVLPIITMKSNSEHVSTQEQIENTIETKTELVLAKFKDIQYEAPNSKEEALQKQHDNEKYMFEISDLIYLSENMEEYNALENIISTEVNRVIEINNLYKVDYDVFVEAEWNAFWEPRMEEYPVATQAWLYMKSLGWSDTVCAGIMGNLMLETGGGTLYLDWDSNGSSGYGLIQWIGGRRSLIKSIYGEFPTVENQIQFVHDELYGTNGVRKQVTASQLNAIMGAETPEDCAYAFACYYERCSVQHRGVRRTYAQRAYEYFVG